MSRRRIDDEFDLISRETRKFWFYFSSAFASKNGKSKVFLLLTLESNCQVKR